MTQNELFRRMKTASQRFESLRECFQQYCQSLGDAIAHKDNPINGIVVERQFLDSGYFVVRFLGQAWRFSFSSRSKEGSIESGIVSVTRATFLPDSPQIDIGLFAFDRDGYTDMTDSGADGDPISMTTLGGALFITMSCIYRGLI